jgi:hypothetical protein
MLTVAQFQSLLNSALEVTQQIVAAQHPLAGSILSAAFAVFEMYEPSIIAALQQKGVIVNS